jgi:hypothetical protein
MCRLRREVINPSIDANGCRIVNTGADALPVVFNILDGTVRSAMRIQERVPILDSDACLEGRATRIVTMHAASSYL